MHTPDGTLRAEHVVPALPPALAVERIDFGDARPAGLPRLARSTPVRMGAVVKVVAQYSSAFWRERGPAGAAFSRAGPLQGIHDMPGPDGRPAALLGFAHARTVHPGFDQTVLAQLAQLFGPAAATPDALYARNGSAQRWTSPSRVQRLDDYSLFGHPLCQRPALEDRLHWAATETVTEHAGHIEGALASGERAALAVLAAPSGADEPGIGVIGAGT
ncbi:MULTISPECIES: flavin monoamine oxidase family protein [Streptomyces]|uniref:Amine oxidase domain-containing protein n=1 Tax=Streptomyces canarius TaxID=285453 RepID=A0ABQ3DCG7_9ACTN|nr:FAD-dependent oxidoreductase [Streptomyces canarius]GHA65113.1 hypothetical protein GCM10010345_81390 [Streptomyces canarius]